LCRQAKQGGRRLFFGCVGCWSDCRLSHAVPLERAIRGDCLALFLKCGPLVSPVTRPRMPMIETVLGTPGSHCVRRIERKARVLKDLPRFVSGTGVAAVAECREDRVIEKAEAFGVQFLVVPLPEPDDSFQPLQVRSSERRRIGGRCWDLSVLCHLHGCRWPGG